MAGRLRPNWTGARPRRVPAARGRGLPDRGLGYPDARGEPELRAQLAAYLGRARGVAADRESVLVTAGAQQAFGLLAHALGNVLGRPPRVAVEDPGMPRYRAQLADLGAEVVGVPVDADGLRVDLLAGTGADAVLATPAHQSPTGAALAPERRRALAAWAREGRLVIEDDYDAEFRYDRPPLAALQGLAPEQVAYVGSASKTLAPGLRLGWIVAPAALAEPLWRRRVLADAGSPTIDQQALAFLLDGGGYDRHLRAARRSYRARRDALLVALERHLPGSTVEGIAAGLHAVVRPPAPVDEVALLQAATARSVGVYPLGWSYVTPRHEGGAMVLGYATLPEPAIREGVRRLAAAVAEAREMDPSAPPSAETIALLMTLPPG
jgi:GntR family transcriptional regulator/MocR family aminotransferase